MDYRLTTLEKDVYPSYKHFVHNTDERVLVLEGELEFEVNGEIIHPITGEELYILAGVIHSVCNIGGTTARWLYCYRLTIPDTTSS